MQTEASVEIERTIEDVFFLTIDHVPEWSRVVVEDEVIDETPEIIGSTFRTVTQEGGNRMVFQGEITAYDPPKFHAIHLTGELFDIDAEYQFEYLGAKTRVTQLSTVTPKGFLKVFFFLFGWLMKTSSCKAAQQELDRLKRFCETEGERTNSAADGEDDL
ncbi:Polyketide cyclase / dehydrase and lipid transport [Thalassoglobus neptunius]|uniref:Polyketide cyclase / dehydrase and lipid transport n=1 Tax=Thalassoglobus neptunius TaxID=1938619 RepID=A0A5C5X6M1_9PLAN|nr:SRPBCC family protein [Thalassoglobus neptunius]TWT58299.1 Polyketide cyclase / dehydrase and lipid transport [Thalassoglobus neptunius]